MSTPTPAPKTTCSVTSTAAGWPNTRFPRTGRPTAPSAHLFDRAEEQVRDLITEASATGAAPGHRSATHRRPLRQLPRRGRPSNAGACNRCSTSWPRSTTPPTPTRWPPSVGALQRTGVGGGVGDVCGHRLQGLDPLPGALHPVRHRIARRILFPRRAARRGAGGLPRTHRADVRPGVRRATRNAHAETAARIVALETKLAAAHWDVVKRRDADLTYNLRTFADLQAEGRGLRLGRLGDRAGRHTGTFAEVVVRQPDYLTAFAALWGSEDLEDWKRWARWRLIRARAPWLTDDLVAADFDFYGRLLTGRRADPGTLEAGGVAGGGPDGRCRRKALRAEAFPAGRQGAHRRVGGELAGGLPASASASWTG